MTKEINFFFEDVKEEDILIDFKAAERWLFKCLDFYKVDACKLAFIFVSDDYLLEMNKKHLDHDYFTDVITFNYNQGDLISGDMFISIDRIKDHAEELKEGFDLEFHRVLVHGVLHLLGYNDKSEEEQTEMTKEEDYCLTCR